MIFDAVYYRERARRAVDELRDVRAAYAAMADNYQRLLLCLDAANERENDLRRLLEEARREHTDAAELLNLVELERDDARREVDEVRAALVWLEKDFKVGGAA